MQARHDDPKAAPAEARRAEGADGAEGGTGERGERGGEKADGVQFGDQCAGEGESGRVVGRKKTEQVGEFSGHGKRGLVEVGHFVFCFPFSPLEKRDGRGDTVRNHTAGYI